MNVACYVTAVTWRRAPLLTRREVVKVILDEVEFYRTKYDYRFCGYVVMPDHWHFILITDENEVTPILRDLKSMIARLVIDQWKQYPDGIELLQQIRLPAPEKRNHLYSLWQDGNWKVLIEDEENIERRLGYMHANPVKAGLVERAVDWQWSSYRWYEYREDVGVNIDMEWVF